MASLPYLVNSDKLRRITMKAKGEKRPGYHLVLKLMPLLFGTANSRGQGIRPAKNNDVRPLLDANKIKAIKGMSFIFEKKHDKNDRFLYLTRLLKV